MFYKNNRFLNQKGQALLVIVLVMVIGLTIGLSIATRTIVNLRNTSDQAASQKALSAAEAGVEQAIKNNASVGTGPGGTFSGVGTGPSTTYSTTVGNSGGSGAFLLNGSTAGAEVPKNDAIYVWVKPYSSDPASAFTQTWSGLLTVYWGNKLGSCSDVNPYSVAALEVSVIYGSKAAPNLKRFPFDPCANRRLTNYFNSATQFKYPISNYDLYYQTTIDLSAYQVLLVRINPIYADALIGVSGNPDLAPQGKVITSTGTADQNSRKITVYEGYPEVPAEFFPFTLFQP